MIIIIAIVITVIIKILYILSNIINSNSDYKTIKYLTILCEYSIKVKIKIIHENTNIKEVFTYSIN